MLEVVAAMHDGVEPHRQPTTGMLALVMALSLCRHISYYDISIIMTYPLL